VNATIADDQGLGKILNDDVTIGISDVTATEGNAGTKIFTFTVTLSAASLLGGLLLAIFAPDDKGPRSAVRPTARGRGALAHRAFIEVLRRLEVRVVVGRVSRPEPGTAVVVAEPSLSRERGPGEDVRLRQLLEEAPRALLVLPKWSGSPDPSRRGYLASAELLPASVPAEVLGAAGIAGQVTRVAESIAPGTWSGELHGAPDLRPAQLLVSKDLQPVLSSNGRLLVGERSTRGGKLLVLEFSQPGGPYYNLGSLVDLEVEVRFYSSKDGQTQMSLRSVRYAGEF